MCLVELGFGGVGGGVGDQVEAEVEVHKISPAHVRAAFQGYQVMSWETGLTASQWGIGGGAWILGCCILDAWVVLPK